MVIEEEKYKNPLERDFMSKCGTISPVHKSSKGLKCLD
jgi:hypothetical protein